MDVCEADQVAEGAMFPFELEENKLVLYRVDGEIYATTNVCSHAFALLSDGWLDDGLVECPLHGAQFDVRDGSVARGPADCPIKCYRVRVQNGIVQTLLDAT